MEIKLSTSASWETIWEVSPKDTVLNFKQKISSGDVMNIPLDQIELIYLGEELRDSFILQDYSIHDGSIIYLKGSADFPFSSDASASKSLEGWKTKAVDGEFDEDLHIVDPQSYFHLLSQLERDVVGRSEYFRENRTYSVSDYWDVGWNTWRLNHYGLRPWLQNQMKGMQKLAVRFTLLL